MLHWHTHTAQQSYSDTHTLLNDVTLVHTHTAQQCYTDTHTHTAQQCHSDTHTLLNNVTLTHTVQRFYTDTLMSDNRWYSQYLCLYHAEPQRQMSSVQVKLVMVSAWNSSIEAGSKVHNVAHASPKGTQNTADCRQWPAINTNSFHCRHIP